MNDGRRDFLKSLIAGGIAPAVALVSAVSEPQTKNIFAYWALDLNGWRWPSDWGEPPEWFHRQTNDHRSYVEQYDIVFKAVIVLAGGWKEVLRVSNVERRQSMTNEEFEHWASNGYSINAMPKRELS